MIPIDGDSLTLEQRAAMWRKFPALLAEIEGGEPEPSSLPEFIVLVTGGHPSAGVIAGITQKLHAVGIARGMSIRVVDAQRQRLDVHDKDVMAALYDEVGRPPKLWPKAICLALGSHASLKPRPATPFWSADYRNKRGRR